MIKFCEKKCFKCKRECVLINNHLNNCDCCTDYQCREFYLNNISKKKFENEKCDEPCDVDECNYNCLLEEDHEENVHDCLNSHICKEKCIFEKCKKSCYKSINNIHVTHECFEKNCIYECEPCFNNCIFEDHFHENFIKEKKEEKLKIKKDNNYEKILKNHLCGNEHQCQHLCQEKGICSIDYEFIKKDSDNEDNKIHQYFKSVNTKGKCKKIIEKFNINHTDRHHWGNKIHTCDEKCLECSTFCSKKMGHFGYHSSKIIK